MARIRKKSSGSCGIYYQLNKKRGLKALQDINEMPMVYKTKKAAMKGWEIQSLRAEFRNHMKAFKLCPKTICKPYGVKAYRMYGGWVVGIELQHLGSVTLYDTRLSEEKISDICYGLSKELAKVNIWHGDLHGGNVMRHKGKLKVIDLDPEHVEIGKEVRPYDFR